MLNEDLRTCLNKEQEILAREHTCWLVTVDGVSPDVGQFMPSAGGRCHQLHPLLVHLGRRHPRPGTVGGHGDEYAVLLPTILNHSSLMFSRHSQ